MPYSLTQKMLSEHLHLDKNHIDLICSALEVKCKDVDYYLRAYDPEQQEHIFKKLFQMVREAYDKFDTEEKIMPFLITGLSEYRSNSIGVYYETHGGIKKPVDIDTSWKTIIFHDAAKLCLLIRETEKQLLDGKIYKPSTPKKRLSY